MATDVSTTTAELALPDPASATSAMVRTELVPAVRAERARIEEAADIEAARALIRWLEAVRRYLTDRGARDQVSAESRRTEVLIGRLIDRSNPDDRSTSRGNSVNIGHQDAWRFRQLAANAELVEQLLECGKVSRKALLEGIQFAPSEVSEPSELKVGRCTTLVADPPWRYGNTATRANAHGHYDGTLTIPQLCGDELLPDGSSLVKDVVEPMSATPGHLYLWTTAGHLPEAFKVMEAWGYEYKTYLVWVKPQMGMGNYFRVSTELVLFGIRGGMRTRDMGLMNWFEEKRGQHSAKPLKFFDLVTRASPGPYLELFARCGAGQGTQLQGTCQCSRCRLGWEVWGNQA